MSHLWAPMGLETGSQVLHVRLLIRELLLHHPHPLLTPLWPHIRWVHRNSGPRKHRRRVRTVASVKCWLWSVRSVETGTTDAHCSVVAVNCSVFTMDHCVRVVERKRIKSRLQKMYSHLRILQQGRQMMKNLREILKLPPRRPCSEKHPPGRRFSIKCGRGDRHRLRRCA